MPIPHRRRRTRPRPTNDLASQECNTKLTGQDLGGQTLTPGVYCFPGSPATLSGELILDAQGDPNAVFVFQVGTTLTTAAKSRVRVLNGGRRCERRRVAFRAPIATGSGHRSATCTGRSATSASLGKESNFLGNIFAMERTSTWRPTRRHDGRALSRSGQLTIDTGISRGVAVRPVLRLLAGSGCRRSTRRGYPAAITRSPRARTDPPSKPGPFDTWSLRAPCFFSASPLSCCWRRCTRPATGRCRCCCSSLRHWASCSRSSSCIGRRSPFRAR